MLTAYPRPQFQREAWLNLNGTWAFAFDDGDLGEREQWYENFPKGLEIQVPYTYETKLSGIGEERFHPVVWYRRKVSLDASPGRVLLNLEGADHRAKVWVNGACAGLHEGGYAAFTLDITPYVKAGENVLTVRVQDSQSCAFPRGKQRWKDENFGCWYVQTTGIWKTVWLETVPECFLEKVKITPDIDTGTAHFFAKIGGYSRGKKLRLTCAVSLKGEPVWRQEMDVSGEYLRFSAQLSSQEEPWKLALWHPEQPNLYDVEFILEEPGGAADHVRSYLGMRKISISGDKVLLNNRPLYQRLILDQGYWEDSHLTPPDDGAYEKDLDLILAAGFNGLRKHQKTEDRRFLALCDRKGVLVWSEMAAQYVFHNDAIGLFTREWMEVVEQNYNHPSVIVWTPFNESWGIEKVSIDPQQQAFTEAIYKLTKAYDPMRPVIVNDGWEHTVSDILTLHDYESSGEAFTKRYADLSAITANAFPFNLHVYAMAKGYAYRGQPVIVSEYGGIALAGGKGWGYGEQPANGEAFLRRFQSITQAIQAHPGICGSCYTQVSDVQQEVNGLYTARREPKVDIEAIRRINMEKD